jgi:hypothetical protein
MTTLDHQFDAGPSAEIKRDRYGRYLLPDPVSGEERSWQRVTTFIKLLSDTYNLDQWRLRQASIGLSKRPDLMLMIASVADPDSKDGKADIQKAVDAAIEAAGASTGANLGTAIHAMTEAVDRGHPLPITTAEIATKIADYTATLERYGLTPVGEWIERVIVNPDLDVAGTADRFVRCADGHVRVADLKTGKTVNFGQLEYAMQLAAYANAAGMWNGTGWDAMPDRLDTATGYVIHLPAQTDEPCEVYAVDLEVGWQACRLAVDVRGARQRRGLLRKVTSLRVAEADDDRRLAVLRRCRKLDPERKAAMKAQWPAAVPGLTAQHQHTDAELDAIEAVLDVIDGTRVPAEVASALRTRMEVLPGDLMLAVEAEAKSQAVPHVERGWSAAHVDILEPLILAAENESAERHMTRVRSLAEFDESIIVDICAFTGVARSDIGRRFLDDLTHERVMAAIETLDLFGTLNPDPQLVVEHHGSKSGLLAAARTAAARHSLSAPKSTAEVVADPLICSLTLITNNSNTKQKEATTP